MKTLLFLTLLSLIATVISQTPSSSPDSYICSGFPCQCSTGYTQLGNVCIKICPAGTQWDGRQCICPSNQVLVSGACQCAFGYYNTSGGVCTVCTAASNDSQCNNVPEGNCAPGAYWSGTGCTLYGTPPNSIRCIPNNTFNQQSQACLPTNGYQTSPPQTCLPSQYWTGVSCLSFTNAANIIYCEKGYTWTSQTCQVSSANSSSVTCPTSQYWDGIQCQRQLGSSVVCQPGYKWNGYQCA